VVWPGAPDCPVCHQTVSGAPGPYRIKLATLGFLQPRSALIHRTIRCTSGATTNSHNGRLQKLWNRWTVKNSALQSQSIESEAHQTVNRTCPMWHQTVRCHKKTTAPTVDCSQTLMVGWRGGAPDSLQGLFGGAPDCPVRPSPAASPTTCLVVEGYKYPQPPQLQAFKISKYHIQCKSSSIH
jgi:hypothetical protein